MNCDRAKELLSDYLNGDLASAERALLEKHIESCSSCRAELRKLKRLRSILTSFPYVDPPSDFTQRVLASYYARKKKASPLRNFFLGGLQPKRAFGYAAIALLLVFAFALLSLLPQWGKAKQMFPSWSTPTLKKAPSIIYARGIGKVLLLPQTAHPDSQGQLRLEIMVYPSSPKERVRLNILLSPGLAFADDNPFLPRQKEYYIGKIDGPVAFSLNVKAISQGVQWIKASCISDNIKWGEGRLFLPSSPPSSNYISLSQNDVDALSLLALLAERTGRAIALPVPLSARLNFSYQGEPEGAIYKYASLLGLTTIKYNGGFIIEIP